MKSFSILALVATLAVVNAADCDTSKLVPLLSDPSIAACTADSGFSFTALSAPTAEALPKICASAACKKLLTAVTSLGLGDCTLGSLKLETDLVTPITTACAKTSTTTGSSAGSKASAATVTAPAPATTTAAPKASAGSSAGSKASSTTVKTPTPTTVAPKSAASTITVAASAAVVAVAAAFM